MNPERRPVTTRMAHAKPNVIPHFGITDTCMSLQAVELAQQSEDGERATLFEIGAVVCERKTSAMRDYKRSPGATGADGRGS